MLALSLFLGRPSIVTPSGTVRWTVAGIIVDIKLPPPISERRSSCSHNLSSRVGKVLRPERSGGSAFGAWRRKCPVDTFRQNYILSKRKPHTFVCGLCWRYLSSRAVARQVLSAQMSLTSVFGMGTGGPSSQSIPTHVDGSRHLLCQKPVGS